MNVTEAYFRTHGSQERVEELDALLTRTTPPPSFTPPAPQRPREHRGKAIANLNARNLATLRSQIPRG